MKPLDESKPDVAPPPAASPASDVPLDPYHLMAPETLADPYPVYARLRQEAPVYFSAAWNGWLVTRYELVSAGLRDPRLSAQRSGAFGGKLPEDVRAKLEPMRRNLASWMLLLDAPDHTRIRSLVGRAFTPRLIEGMRPRVEALCGELLDAAPPGEMDVIRDLATPLPLFIIGEMLGVPAEDRPRLKGWSKALAGLLGSGRPSIEAVLAALSAIVDLEDYFRGEIARRRRQPGSDLLSQLIGAEEQGVILGEQELLSTCCNLLFGGHETTTNLIGNGLLALFRNPSELDALRASPELIGAAVEELLRYDAPVQWISRIALEDIALEGSRIGRGDRVYLVFGAANRDPAQFPEPDRLDVRRAEIRHLTFGLGAHYCIGAALARMEAQIALRAFLDRYPRAALSESPPVWRNTPGVRGLEALPVKPVGA